MNNLIDNPEYGRIVDVYRNLNKGCYSVRCVKTRLVIYHADEICLGNVTFRVSQKMRLKVKTTGVKNVHAFVRGVWEKPTKKAYKTLVFYNPKQYAYFHKVIEGVPKPMFSCKWAMLDRSGMRISNKEKK